jgi:hypothetical protein
VLDKIKVLHFFVNISALPAILLMDNSGFLFLFSKCVLCIVVMPPPYVTERRVSLVEGKQSTAERFHSLTCRKIICGKKKINCVY